MLATDFEADSFVRSLARGFDAIRAFRPGRGRMTIAQVANACGFTRASARRILLTLHSLGYVGVDGRNFYLTARVLDLGQGFLAQPVWDVARPVLQSVASNLNETVSAGVLEGADVVLALRLRSSRIIHLELSAGTHLPAHASSMGRVLLAALSPPALERYFLEAQIRKYTKFTIDDVDLLRRRIDEVRKQGWSCVRGEIDESTTCISVPLVGSDGRTLAALNVGVNTDRATVKTVKSVIVPALRDAATSIASALHH